jgi:protein-glutamine gamma-glutamyltransferase
MQWRDTRIPRRPLLWLATALLFTLPPMFGRLATWVPCLFLTTLALKFWMEPKGYRLRFAASKLALAVVALAAIFASYGSLKGVEPGVSLLVVLMSLKILEAHTAREFQVMVMMAWVLCLCGFSLSQDFAIALCLMAAFVLLLVALVQFHRGSSPGAFWPPLATTCKLLGQAAPLVILLFFLFPRNPRSPFGYFRLFRSTFSWQHRVSCKFIGYRVPRRISRQQNSTAGSPVLAGDSHVALRRDGVASAARSGSD